MQETAGVLYEFVLFNIGGSYNSGFHVFVSHMFDQ